MPCDLCHFSQPCLHKELATSGWDLLPGFRPGRGPYPDHHDGDVTTIYVPSLAEQPRTEILSQPSYTFDPEAEHWCVSHENGDPEFCKVCKDDIFLHFQYDFSPVVDLVVGGDKSEWDPEEDKQHGVRQQETNSFQSRSHSPNCRDLNKQKFTGSLNYTKYYGKRNA